MNPVHILPAYFFGSHSMRAVCKVRGPTLLLRVGTLWRCGDGLFFEVPPLTSDALLTTLHPLLENVLQSVDHFEISCLGVPFSWLKKPRNRIGRDLDCVGDVLSYTHLLFPSRTQNSIQISSVTILGEGAFRRKDGDVPLPIVR
jgi:hypothetical protein